MLNILLIFCSIIDLFIIVADQHFFRFHAREICTPKFKETFSSNFQSHSSLGDCDSNFPIILIPTPISKIRFILCKLGSNIFKRLTQPFFCLLFKFFVLLPKQPIINTLIIWVNHPHQGGLILTSYLKASVLA